MVKKETKTKKKSSKTIRTKKKVTKKKVHPKTSKKSISKKTQKKTSTKKTKVRTLNLMTDTDIAVDFGTKAYELFGRLIKSVILFGSVQEKKIQHNSDIDLIVLIDDASVKWDQELIAWYREELDKLIKANPYMGNLHINTIKLTTWWEDLMKGDPVVLNIIRKGQPVIDHAGFIEPLKHLMIQGKIKSTPEAIYQCMQRSPGHLARSRAAELSAIDGIYWSMVDSAHGALMAANYFPPSPEHVPIDLKEAFVDKGNLKMKYVLWYKEIYDLHKKIDHGEILDLKGVEIDYWQKHADEFLKVMINLVDKIVSK